jgi:D-amino-acid oxidase
MSRVIVIGAGVVGLSCAVRLLERGHQVAVIARDLPLETTSAVAAAIWYPHRAYPFERVAAWGATTYDELGKLAAVERSGVVLRQGTQLLRQRSPRPWWAGALPELKDLDHVLPPYRGGWEFETPVVEMPVYLRWLTDRIETLGGTLTRMALGALPTTGAVVVNAGGLGARLFAGDGSVVPVRGQVVLVEQVGLERWWLDGGDPTGGAPATYVVPRSQDIVVGGTEDEGEWDRSPDPAASSRILERAAELVPELRGARVLGVRVGLRPARPAVRLELEERTQGPVVHCYGHGGAGVTLSWGCADEVADLVDVATMPTHPGESSA